MAGRYYLYSPYDGTPLEDVTEIRYGDLDLERVPRGVTSGPNVLYVDEYLSASDYSDNDGGVVRTNVDYFTENHGDSQGTMWWALHGRYSSFGVAVRADVLDENSAYVQGLDEDDADEARRIREDIERLENYPLLDEEAQSELERQQQDEQWPDAAEHIYFSNYDDPSGRWHGQMSFAAALARIVAPYLPEREEEDWAEQLNNVDSLYGLYGELGDAFSIYPLVEGSGDNLAAVFYLDDFVRKLDEAVDALPPPLDTQLAQLIVTAVQKDNAHALLRYNTRGYELIRLGRDARRMGSINDYVQWLPRLDTKLSPDEVLILNDALLESSPEKVQEAFYDGTLIERLKQGPLSGLGTGFLNGKFTRWKS